jgi:hypothetical protein
MGAICVLYVPGTRRSGGVVGLIKEIGLPFVAGTRAGTVCDQGKAWLHIFLLDPTAAVTTTGTTAASSVLLMLLLLLLLLLL